MVYKGRERDKITESKFSKQRNGKERFCQDVGLRNFVFLRFLVTRAPVVVILYPVICLKTFKRSKKRTGSLKAKLRESQGSFLKADLHKIVRRIVWIAPIAPKTVETTGAIRTIIGFP